VDLWCLFGVFDYPFVSAGEDCGRRNERVSEIWVYWVLGVVYLWVLYVYEQVPGCCQVRPWFGVEVTLLIVCMSAERI
jgi:hypothetical protein